MDLLQYTGLLQGQRVALLQISRNLLASFNGAHRQSSPIKMPEKAPLVLQPSWLMQLQTSQRQKL